MGKGPAVTDAQALPAACGCVLFCFSKYVGLWRDDTAMTGGAVARQWDVAPWHRGPPREPFNRHGGTSSLLPGATLQTCDLSTSV